MVDVRVVDAAFDSCETDCLVVGVFSSKEIAVDVKSFDAKLGGVIAQVVKSFEGEYGQFRLIQTLGKVAPKHMLLLGLGKKEDFSLDVLRKAAGLSVKLVRDQAQLLELATTLHEIDVAKVSRADRAHVVAEGSVLGAYQYIKYRTVERQKIKVFSKVLILGKSEFNAHVAKGVSLAECSCLVRDLQNEPASNLHPKELANEAKKLEKLGVKVTVFDKKQIEKVGLTALLAVNRGSVNEPRFVIMEYRGGGKKKVALVGKGITFDSGGLDIKTAEGMLTMKEDMSGAAVVLATVKAAAELKLKVNVVGVFAATENMPGLDAYKPGDVVKTYSGKTIEIANTDAEGRVILSDALAYTEKHIKPDVMVDLATLTGACVVALGSVCAGVMGKDRKIIDQLIASGLATGERVWELPFFKEYHDQVKSEIADLRNLGIVSKEGGAITAGAFLGAFVEKTPWAHIDIAGTSWSEQDGELSRKGGTGYGVRLLINFLEALK